MSDWDSFDNAVCECEECGSLSHPELCPKHAKEFEEFHKQPNRDVEKL